MTEDDLGRDDRLHGLPLPLQYDPALTASSPIRGEPGTVVLLVAGQADREWAAAAAVGLAGAWARDGRRVVLADLHLENPLLHEVTGNRNLEGVVDVFLYGASIARSARPVAGQGFFLIPAGTYEPDAEAIYHHPRWPKIVAGFRDASATLVLFVPSTSADVAAVSEWVDRVVLLGEPGTGGAVGALASRGVEPGAMLVSGRGEGGSSRGGAGSARGEAAVRDPWAEPAADAAGAAATGGVTAPVGPRPPERAGEIAIPPAPRRARRGSRRGVYTVLLVLAAAALVALAGYLLARYRPDLVPWAAGGAAPAEAAPAGEAGPVASRLGDPLPYSVQVKAFTALPAAMAQVREERERFGSQPFYVSPEEIQGVLYFKVLAGLVADTTEATRLRAELVTAGSVEEEEAVGSWSLIQFTPLAFDLGEFPSDSLAAAREDSLAMKAIPAYRVAVPYSDGTHRWQLYAGAYRDSLSAEAMRQRLVAAGMEPRLVARIGDRGQTR